MLAVFGIPGHVELLIIGMLCLMVIGVPLIVLAVVLWISRRNRGDGGS